MMKRIKLNIFRKTFLIAVVMMLIITLIAYLVLYLLIPQYYRHYKINQFNQLSEQLTEQLENTDTADGEKQILTDFAQKTSAEVNVYNEDRSVFFNLSVYHGIKQSEVIGESTVQSEQKIVVAQQAEDGDSINLEYSYHANGELRYLQMIVALQPLNEAKAVIISIYPIAGLLCIVFSFLLAMVFSHSFVKPIRTIRSVTSEMTLLAPDASIPVTSEDEIGELSRDINHLYQELRGTILALEHEVKIYSDLENTKIDFLRTISHELKTPLASANALIEGIIYDVEPYCTNSDQYLKECKSFLDKAIVLTKESLNLSPDYNEESSTYQLKSLIAEVFPQYQVIVKSKQIQYTTEIPDDIYVRTKIKLFSHALSNLFSNAANYTSAHGVIHVRYSTKDGALMIENTCTPLTDEELRTISLPFRSGKKRSELSNGLGLYIVKQILGLLELKFSFLPMENQKGMRFTIDIPPVCTHEIDS